MRSRLATAWAEAPFELPRATHADLASLRSRLASATSQDAVAVDALEDDLREAESALGAVTDWLGAVEEALRDPRVGKRDLLAMALGGSPVERIEYLGSTVQAIRRRLAQVGTRLPEPSR